MICLYISDNKKKVLPMDSQKLTVILYSLKILAHTGRSSLELAL